MWIIYYDDKFCIFVPNIILKKLLGKNTTLHIFISKFHFYMEEK